MKKSFDFGPHHVEVDIRRHAHDILSVTATCGITVIPNRKMHAQGPHNHPAEQAAKDVDAFCERIAKEAAGKEQARLHLDSIFEGSKNAKAALPSAPDFVPDAT